MIENTRAGVYDTQETVILQNNSCMCQCCGNQSELSVSMSSYDQVSNS